jgi:hypothetical protein
VEPVGAGVGEIDGGLVQFGVLRVESGVKVKINGFGGFDVNSKLNTPNSTHTPM